MLVFISIFMWINNLSAMGLDGTYKLGINKKDQGLAVFALSAKFPEKRKPTVDENKKDKAKLDKKFAKKLKKFKKKLKDETVFTKWCYIISKAKVDSLLKKRSELIKNKKVAKKKSSKKNKK